MDGPDGPRTEEAAVPHASSPTLLEVREAEASAARASTPPEASEAFSHAQPGAGSRRKAVSGALARLADLSQGPASSLLSLATWRHRVGNAVSSAKDLVEQALANDVTQTARQVVEGSYRAVATGLGASPGPVDAFGRDATLASDLAPLADLLLNRYWRVSVEGIENVPAGRAVLVANHAGALPLDGPVLHHALSRLRPELRESRWLVEDQVFDTPFLGVLLNRLGAVRASSEGALRLLEEERPVVVFPEGAQGLGKRFHERYQLRQFGRGGFVKVARKAKAPIVPVAILGSEETSPLLAKIPTKLFGLRYLPVTSPIPLPAKWIIRFGSPISPGDGADEAVRTTQIVDQTRDAIQQMLRTMLAQRGSVFSG